MVLAGVFVVGLGADGFVDVFAVAGSRAGTSSTFTSSPSDATVMPVEPFGRDGERLCVSLDCDDAEGDGTAVSGGAPDALTGRPPKLGSASTSCSATVPSVASSSTAASALTLFVVKGIYYEIYVAEHVSIFTIIKKLFNKQERNKFRILKKKEEQINKNLSKVYLKSSIF